MNTHGATVCGIALLLGAFSAQAQQTVEVTVHDFAGLSQAISDSNQRVPGTVTSIHVVGEIVWPHAPLPDDLPLIRRKVLITGGVFREEGGGIGLFHVEPSGHLTVSNSTFSHISHAGLGPVIFSNKGDLVLQNVSFESVSGSGGCSRGCKPSHTAIIHNQPTGTISLDGVRFDDSGMTPGEIPSPPENTNGILANEGKAELNRVQVYLSHNRWEQPLWNSGDLRVQNSSFLVRDDPQAPSLDLVELADGARTEFVNSVFDGFTGSWCGQVDSLGHNSHTSPACTWASAEDIVGEPTGLSVRRTADAFDLIPGAASNLIDSADGASCIGPAIFDGDGDGVAACDRGAFELRLTPLAEGGINGFYNNSAHTGNYVYIQQTDYTTLVVWNTFDANGDPAWIYGIGEVVGGRTVIADAYINRAGGFSPEGLGANVEAESWGELEVDLESCAEGHVTYRSDLPEFGSGDFPIKRLAFVKELGCIDPQ